MLEQAPGDAQGVADHAVDGPAVGGARPLQLREPGPSEEAMNPERSPERGMMSSCRNVSPRTILFLLIRWIIDDLRYIGVHVGAVEQRIRDPRPVPLDDKRQTAAGVAWGPQVVARAGVRGLFAMSS